MKTHEFLFEGTWRGSGTLENTLHFDEVMVIKKHKKDVYDYFHRSICKENSETRSESGFITISDHNRTAGLTIMLPGGLCSPETGSMTDNCIELNSKHEVRSPHLDELHTMHVKRILKIEHGKLLLNIEIAKDSEPYTPHFEAEFKKT